MANKAVVFVIRFHKSESVRRKDGKFPIVLQVTWERKVRRKRTGLFAHLDQWDFENHEFKKGTHGRWENNTRLEEWERRAKAIYQEHFDHRPFSYRKFSTLIDEKRGGSQSKVAAFCHSLGEDFIKRGQIRSGKYYKAVSSAILKVTPQDLAFSDFTEEWLEEFEDYHVSRGVKCYNYMVHLRSLFNKGVKARVADYKYHPFKNKHTNPYGYDFSHLKNSKISKARDDREKDLTLEEVIMLKDTSDMTPLEQKYMAIWFFSFYNVGVNLTDIAKMKYKDIKNGRWFYARSKTDVSLKIGKPLIPAALKIIKDFGTRGLDGPKDAYVFDILPGHDKSQLNVYNRIDRYCHRIYRACLRISKRKKFDGTFTFYSARHTVCSLLLNSGADKKTVSHLMDQANFSTIDKYVGRADSKKVDEVMNVLRELT